MHQSPEGDRPMVAGTPVPVRRRRWHGPHPVSCADVPLDRAPDDVEHVTGVPARSVETFVAARKDLPLGRPAPCGPYRPATDQEPSRISQGDDAMQSVRESPDPAETARRARFGKL